MLRPLLTLVVGIALAVLLTAVIAGGRSLAPVLGPILITAGIGSAVLAVVVHRARIRDRALDLGAAQDTPARQARDETDKEPDRG